jgi:hypothetical protein
MGNSELAISVDSMAIPLDCVTSARELCGGYARLAISDLFRRMPKKRQALCGPRPMWLKPGQFNALNMTKRRLAPHLLAIIPDFGSRRSIRY